MVHLIDCYAYTSRWRQRHPAEKAVFALGMLGLSLALPPGGAALVLAAVCLVALLGARIPAGLFIRVLSLPSAFILVGAATLLVSIQFDHGRFHLQLVQSQWIPALAVSLRALAAAAALIFFALTTPAADWIPLLRHLRIPAAVVDLMMVTYRFLFIFAERLVTLQQAQAARLGTRTFKTRIRTSGLILANLLIRSVERARQLELGMAARCYEDEIPFLPHEQKPSARVMAGALAACLLIAVLGLLTKGWPHA